jgi:uncharacterized membrane protein
MEDQKSKSKKLLTALQNIATVLCAVFFTLAGWLHFQNPNMYKEIVPDILPFPIFLVYLSGACEIAGGVGLMFPKLRKLASYGLIALLVAVFPANINMAVNSIDFGLPHEILWWRLPFQLVFIVWVYWCGRDR